MTLSINYLLPLPYLHNFQISGSPINISNQSSFLTKLSTMATKRDFYILATFFVFYIAKVEAGRGGFLYICIGSECTPGQIALMVITIILVFFCCGAGAYCKCKQKNRSKVFSYAKMCNEYYNFCLIMKHKLSLHLNSSSN